MTLKLRKNTAVLRVKKIILESICGQLTEEEKINNKGKDKIN